MSLTKASYSLISGAPLNVLDYGADATGVVDSYLAVQAAITAAFSIPGGEVVFPSGNYRISQPLQLPDSAGTISLKGLGRPKSFTGGVTGDPTAVQGAQLTYTGANGDLFTSTLTGGDQRQYITIESLTFQGNSAGATGSCIRFNCALATSAMLVCYRDVTCNGAAEHGIFHNGNVFECQLINVRISQNANRGFLAQANGSGIPGETRFYGCSFNANLLGIDLSGGGRFSYFGLTCSNNTIYGFKASGVSVVGTDLQLEANGPIDGDQMYLTSLQSSSFTGILITTISNGTGNGIYTDGTSFMLRFHGVNTNSSVTGAGYYDINFSDSTSRCEITGYVSNDFINRIFLGVGGGHVVHNANAWASGQSHSQQTISLASGNATPNAILYDDILVTVTGAATITVTNPTMSSDGLSYHAGQILVFEFYNNSGGSIGINFGGFYALAGAITPPANGKRRTIQFHWNANANLWVELSRSAADI
jgi:hypothetical protein